MAGSTWTWIGTTSNPSQSSNWALTNGPGNSKDRPQSGDTAIDSGGTTVSPLLLDTQLNSVTFEMLGNATVQFANDTTSASSSSIDSFSTIDAFGTATTLPIAGPFSTAGTIEVTGTNASLSIPITAGAAATGSLTNTGQIIVDQGDTLSINGGSFSDPGAVTVDGTATISGTLTGLGNYAIGNGGSLILNDAGTVGLTEITFAGSNGSTGVVKLDDPEAFAGNINGFVLGDTLDLGPLNITTIVFDGQNDIIALNNTGTVFEANAGGVLGGSGNQGTFTLSGTGGLAGNLSVSEGSGDTMLTGLSPSTWLWHNASSSFSLVSGPGNGFDQPTAGDTAIVTAGTVQLGSNPQLTSNTIELGGTAGVAELSGGGASNTNLQSPSLDGNTLITSDVPGNSTPETSVLAAQGIWINEGTIQANGPAGSSFTLAISSTTINGTFEPGSFINYNDIEVDAGNSMTITVAGTSELFNAGEIVVDGGSLVINAATNAIAGGYAPVGGVVVIFGGGSVETNSTYVPGGNSGTIPTYAFADATPGNTLKIDNVGSFGGAIFGFGQNDTIDLGATLSVGKVVYSTSTGLLNLENSAGSILATLLLGSGNFQSGTFAVAGGTAGSFNIGTGADGNTVLTTNVQNDTYTSTSGAWQTGSLWSNGVPGTLDTALIGIGAHNAFTLTTGSTPVSVGAIGLTADKALLQITSNTTATPYTTRDFAGTLEVTSGNTLTLSQLSMLGGTTEVDPGAVLDLTGHSIYPIGATGGTLAVTSGNTAALGLFNGSLLVNGGIVNAGTGQAGANGGRIYIGRDGGGTPAEMTVTSSGTNAGVVTDTYSVIGSDPVSYGELTLNGNVSWTDEIDPHDTLTTRGFMQIGANAQQGNASGSPLPNTGSATVVVENGATLTEQTYAELGVNPASGGIVEVYNNALWNIGASATGGFLTVGQVGGGDLFVGNSGTVAVGNGGTFLNNGTTITGSGIAIGQSSQAIGTITVSGAGALITDLSGINVGQAGTGDLQILNGGTIQLTGTSGINVGTSLTGVGSMLVSGIDPGTGASAVLSMSTSTKGITVGGSGQGTLDVESGGTILMNGTGGIAIAQSLVSSVGLVIVNGQGALINEGTNANGMPVGVLGNGTLLITNGGTVSLNGTNSSAGISVGQSAGAQGLILVSGTQSALTLNTPNAALIVGGGGQGTMQVQGGGAVSINGKGLNVGTNLTGSGTVSVSGIGSSITTLGTGGISVGSPGTGVLAISNGGSVFSSGSLFIGGGGTTAANGTVTVNGGTLTDAGQLSVGFNGSGTLDVGIGGQVQVTGTTGVTVGGFFPPNGGGSGVLVINGGTLSDLNGSFSVGNTNASGSLLVQGGGSLISTGAFGAVIDASGSGKAAATVTGGTWDTTALTVGNAGSGSLDINSHGLVNSGTSGITVGNSAGATGVISIESGGTLIAGGMNIASPFSGGSSTGIITIGDGGTLVTTGITEGGGGTITVGGTSNPAQLTDNGFMNIGQSGSTAALLTVNHLGTVSNNGTSTLQIGSSVGSSGTVTVNGGTLTTNGFGDGGPGTGVLIVENGGLFISDGGTQSASVGTAFGSGFNGSGTVVVNGGTLNATGASFTIGGTNTTGSLLVEGGGVLTTSIGASQFGIAGEINAAGTGHATATVSGGTWNVNGQLNVGDNGSGSLDINSNGRVVNTGTNGVGVGNQGGANGTLTVESGGTLIGNSLNVANTFTGMATGVVKIGDGGFVDVGSLQESGGGTITVGGTANPAQLITTGFVDIGQQPGATAALLTVNQFGTVTNSGTFSFEIGGNTGASGSVTVNGGTLIADGLGIGGSGTGVLLVEGGGLVVDNGGTSQSTGVGSAFGSGFSGSGSLIINGGTLNETGPSFNLGGTNTTGTLLVENGGLLNTSVTAGLFSGFAGELNASGTGHAAATVSGGTWNVNGQFNVGDTGTGSLDINSNGLVDVTSNSGVSIGNQAGAAGTVSVESGGTLISTAGGLSLADTFGGPTSGVLIVGDGGTVEVSQIREGGGGTITVGGTAHSALLSAGSLNEIGQFGTGAALIVNKFGTVTGGAFLIGNGGSSTVTVNAGTLSGGSLSLSSSSVLTVEGGGVVSATGTNSSVNDTGSSVVVNGGTLSDAGGFQVYAFSSTGTVLVENGGTLITGNSTAVSDIYGSGTAQAAVTVSDGIWTSNGQLIVGDNGGPGSLDINSNGVVNAGTNGISIGNNAGASGIVSVESGGTLIGGSLNIANVPTGMATGVLTVGDGGTVQVGSLTESGGGTITVGGTAHSALLTASGGITIGQSGTGAALTINQFGTVTDSSTSSALQIGSSVGSSGTVTVNGGTLTTDGFGVGGTGTGAMIVENGGLVIDNGGTNPSSVGSGFGSNVTINSTPSLTTLVNFNGTDGSSPYSGLITDAAGDLFGTTYGGGANSDGTVFEITKVGGIYGSTPTTLVNFNGADGNAPIAGLITDAAGDLFGSTTSGGANGDGTVFEIAKTGGSYASAPTTLVSFNNTNGNYPEGGLIADAAGDLFGTTYQGGANGDGTVFEIADTGGSYASSPSTLVNFNGPDGANPVAGLIADAAGDLFGTTFGGGANSDGTVFEIAKTGDTYASTPTTLVSFNNTDGASPYGKLVVDAAGDLFGTTYGGGANGDGTVFEIANNGGTYASTPTTLVNFNGTDGAYPFAGLIIDAAGDLFGTTSSGGANGDGTAFEIAKTGGTYASTPTTLANFNGTNGEYPYGNLTSDAAGNMFGATSAGGANSGGTVFELSGINQAPTVESTSGSGSLIVNGGTLNETGTSFNVGGTNTTGTLLVENGGLLNTSIPVGAFSGLAGEINASGTGQASATVNGGTWNVNGQLNVGDSGVGSLDINSNGVVNAGTNSVTIGQATGSSGTISLESGGTLLASNLTIGQSSSAATLTMSGGKVVTTGNVTVAGNPGSSGTVTVSGGMLDAGGQLTIGNQGNGLVTVNAGGSLVASGGLQIDLGIGLTAGNGTLVVNGGSVVDSGSLSIGTGGTAVVIVEAGGTLNATGNTTSNIGSSSGGTASVTVNGGVFTTSGAPLFIGNGGNASMLVENAGTAVTTFSGGGPGVDINASGTAQASVTVTGANSVWDLNGLNGQFVVGDNGNGSLTVSAGAVVNAGTSDVIDIGNQSGGSGTITVGGGGAELLGRSVNVGSGSSTGILTVNNGGSVAAATALNIGQGSTLVLGGGMVSLSGGGALTSNSGTISGSGVVGSAISNSASVIASGGTLDASGAVSGTGQITIMGGAAFRTEGAVATSQSIVFASSASPEELILDAPGSGFANAITGLNTGDRIELNLGASTISSASVTSPGTITVVTSSGNYMLTNVSFNTGGTPSLITGVDAVTGDSYVQIGIVASTASWAADVSGDFDNAARWSTGNVPGTTTDATINFADQPMVIHGSGSDTLHSLTNTAGDLVMSGGTLAAATLTNDSAMSWTGGTLVLNGGTLSNAAGATLSITPNGQRLLATGAATLANAGSITVDGALGEADVDAAVINTGNVLVNRGTLSLNGGGSSNASVLQTGPAGVLAFGAPAGQTSGGTFALTGGTYGGVETVISGSTLDASGASNVFFNDLRLTASGALLLGATNAQTNAAFVQGGTVWGNAVGTSLLSGSGNFVVFGGASITGGVQSGSGLTRLFGTGSIGGGFSIDGGRTVENDSFLSWSSGNIILGAGDPTAATQSGTLANVGSGILYVTAPGARLAVGGSGVLSNSGVVAFYAGAGEQDVDASVNNTGYVQALSGVVSLNGGGSSDAGHLIVASGATLQFGARAGTTGGATFTLTSGGLTAGSVIISGSTLDASAASGGVSIGTLQLAGSGALLLGAQSGQASGGFSQGPGTFENASGTPFLSGTGTFLVFGGANLFGGVQSGSGVTHMFGTSVLGGSGFSLDGGRTLENDGWLNWSSGNLTLGSGDAGAVTHAGTLTNASGATMFVTASGSRIANAAGGVVNNAGVMAVYAGGGEVDIDAAFNNTGYLQALSGVVSLNGGGSSDAGHLIEGSGAVLQFGTAASGVGGTFSVTGGFYNAAVTQVTGGLLDLSAASGASFGTSMAVSGSGVLNLGTLFVNENALSVTGGGEVLSNGIAVVAGPAVLGNSVLSGTGTTVLNAGGSINGALQIDGGLSLQNSGTLVWSGGSIALGSGNPGAANQAGTLNNTAVLLIEANGTLSSPGSGTVFNSGTLEKVGGTGTTLVNASMSNSGTVMVSSGTLSFAQSVGGSGTLDVEGSARLDFASVVGNSASIAFIGGGGTLAIDTLGTTFGAGVSGFALGDAIDLTSVQSGGGTGFNFNAGTLTVNDGTHSASLNLVGSYSNGSFTLASDGHGGTLVLHT